MDIKAATRPLTDDERRLARWMLENGAPEARAYLGQLEVAEATLWRCPCGCASFDFKVAGLPAAPPSVRVLGDFLFGGERDLSAVCIFESAGILSGIEVTAFIGDAQRVLPSPELLRPWEDSLALVPGAGIDEPADGGVDVARLAEVERRLQDVDRDAAKFTAWESVRDRIAARLRSKRE